MKRFNYYLGLLLMMVFATSCHEEFDQPPVYIPVADAVPNMTIAEFKAKHWQESANYVDTVTEDEVIHGWVTANDISNNIYRTVYISDGSAAISISVKQSNLYEKYRIGQEIVLPMKGHYVGKATGMLNVAAPYNYVNNSGAVTLECYQMPPAELESYVQFNLMPDVSKIDTIDVKISDFQNKFDSETLLKYQGMLVRIRDVEFVEANGKTQFAEVTSSSASTNRTIMDEDGNTLIVRNSKSADFAANVMPIGRVDVVGVISYYQTGSSTWQFYLRTADDVIGEGKKGTKAYPYTVADAIEAQNTGAKGWVEGYIVGAVAPEVTTVSSNADIEWTAPTTLDNTIVIANDPNCKDYTQCIIIPLPQGSSFRSKANLKDNTNAYKAYMKAKGELATYMGAAGLINNGGTTSEYVLDVAYDSFIENFEDGIPGDWTNIAVQGSTLWGTYSYGNPKIYCAQFRITSTNSSPVESWLITPKLDIKKARSKTFSFASEVNNTGNINIELYLLDSNDPTTATVKVKLNPKLPAHPGSGYSAWTQSGEIDLSDWADGSYYIGFCYAAPAGSTNSTWCVNDVKFAMGDPAPPETRADFETMGDNLGVWGTYNSKKGWVATNCMLLRGADYDNNPEFKFIGFMPGSTTKPAYAPTLNGNTTSVGKIVSPVLKGGMRKLTFNYGYAFSGKVIRFRVDVKQNGNVVKTWEVSQEGVSKYTVFTFDEIVNVSGDFTIEFTNLCPSNAASEKDRLSIWNVEWEQ